MSETSAEDNTVSKDAAKQDTSTGNFIPDSLDFYFTFNKPYLYTRDDALAKIVQVFGDHDESAKEADPDIRIFWKKINTSLWLDNETLMVVFWFTGNVKEDEERIAQLQEKLREYIKLPGLPTEYNRFRVSASGYFFPPDSETSETSRQSVQKLMNKLLPLGVDNLYETSMEITTKLTQGKKTVVYSPVRNQQTEISALGLEANYIVTGAIVASEVEAHISSLDIRKDLDSERQKLAQLI